MNSGNIYRRYSDHYGYMYLPLSSFEYVTYDENEVCFVYRGCNYTIKLKHTRYGKCFDFKGRRYYVK